MDQSTGGQYGGSQPPAGPPPWQPPVGGPPSGGGGGEALARSKVAGPAIGLMVTAGVGIALQICNILVHIFAAGLSSAFAEHENAVAQMLSGTIGIILGSFSILVGVVIFLGAQKMKNLESYSLAMVATILAMVPCVSPCCCIGLPIGIWALVVLLDPTVKSSFRS